MAPSALIVRSLWDITSQGRTAPVRLGVKGSQVRILSARRRSEALSEGSEGAFFRPIRQRVRQPADVHRCPPTSAKPRRPANASNRGAHTGSPGTPSASFGPGLVRAPLSLSSRRTTAAAARSPGRRTSCAPPSCRWNADTRCPRRWHVYPYCASHPRSDPTPIIMHTGEHAWLARYSRQRGPPEELPTVRQAGPAALPGRRRLLIAKYFRSSTWAQGPMFSRQGGGTATVRWLNNQPPQHISVIWP
jgi:hypothetical protein